MISSGGHSRETDQTYRWDGLARGSASFCVLQLTLAGEGRLDKSGESLTLPERTLMVVDIPSPHLYYLPPDQPQWEFVFLVVYGSELMRLISGITRRAGNVFQLAENSRIPALFGIILQKLFSPAVPGAFEISSMAYQVCMGLLEESYAQPASEDPSRFESLKKLLRENLQKSMRVSEMAEMAGLSRSHFARLFREREGVSPREYVQDLRLKKAVTLLYSRRLSVKEIAYSCGISDVNYFCRLFRKHTGMSPGEYRRSAL
jgi:AraC-like DNA-binding protein